MYFRLRLKDKRRGKFLHILKMETKETPERTKATGITTQDLQQEGVHTALKSTQTDSVHLSHKLPEAPPSTEGQLCPPCLDPARWRISRRLPALTCSTFFFPPKAIIHQASHRVSGLSGWWVGRAERVWRNKLSSCFPVHKCPALRSHSATGDHLPDTLLNPP